MNGSVFSMEPFLVFVDWESSLWRESYPVRNDLIPVGFSQTDQVHLISVGRQQQNTHSSMIQHNQEYNSAFSVSPF